MVQNCLDEIQLIRTCNLDTSWCWILKERTKSPNSLSLRLMPLSAGKSTVSR